MTNMFKRRLFLRYGRLSTIRRIGLVRHNGCRLATCGLTPSFDLQYWWSGLFWIHFLPMQASSEQASFPLTDILVPDGFLPCLSACVAFAGVTVGGFTSFPIHASSSQTSLLDTDMDDRKLRLFAFAPLGVVFIAGLLQTDSRWATRRSCNGQIHHFSWNTS